MTLEFDQYFTPPSVAERVFRLSGVTSAPHVCIDPTCGTGNLLDAASRILGSTKCIGIDKDREVISKLKQARPDWRLTSGDILDNGFADEIIRQFDSDPIDLLVLNPPFSQSSTKFVTVEYGGRELKGSAAMACLLRSLDLFQPKQGAILIAPESMLFSAIDEPGRSALSREFLMSEILPLSSSTFRGARANSVAMRVAPGSSRISNTSGRKRNRVHDVQLIRGGLQVHCMREDITGVPFVHSTAIRRLILDRSIIQDLPRTSWKGSGRIHGWCFLLPRVGIPSDLCLRAIFVKSTIQLSDCVIAIQCSDRISAIAIEAKLADAYASLRDLYRGTGARYVTLSRLKGWLAHFGIRTPD